jgi:hypothetical protein
MDQLQFAENGIYTNDPSAVKAQGSGDRSDADYWVFMGYKNGSPEFKKIIFSEFGEILSKNVDAGPVNSNTLKKLRPVWSFPTSSNNGQGQGGYQLRIEEGNKYVRGFVTHLPGYRNIVRRNRSKKNRRSRRKNRSTRRN